MEEVIFLTECDKGEDVFHKSPHPYKRGKFTENCSYLKILPEHKIIPTMKGSPSSFFIRKNQSKAKIKNWNEKYLLKYHNGVANT
jgi:hypothetical protein